MSKNTINARLINIHDIEERWKLATEFIPRAGELVVYDVDGNSDFSRCKLGDGIKTVNELPFMVEAEIERYFNFKNGVIYLDGGNIKDYS